MRHSVRSFWGALIVWVCATVIEALTYQTYRLLLAGSIESSWFFSVLSRYLLFRLAYSLAPVLVGAALIHAYKLNPRWAYLVLAIATLLVPAYFTLCSETPQFDPAIIGFCLASIGGLYLLHFKRPD